MRPFPLLCAAVAAAAAEPLVLENPAARAAIDPAIGGRVMSFRAAGREWLWHGADTVPREPTAEKWWDYAQLGGFHLWPAPQARWKADGRGWPPPARMDHGAYTALTAAAGEIALRAPIEDAPGWSCFGIGAELRYRLAPASTRLQVTSTFANHGEWPQWWSHWHIVTVRLPLPAAGAPRGWASFPVRADSAAGPQGFYRQTGTVPVVRDGGLARLPYTGVAGKLSADSDGGWLAAEDREAGAALVLRFTVESGKPFGAWPEGNSTLAVFTNEQAGFCELELMGPEQEIAPGAATTYTAEWAACRVDGLLVAASAAGATVRPLALAGGRITGSFGVFDLGTAELVADGAVVRALPCTPEAPLVIDEPATGATYALRVGGRILASIPPAASPTR